MPSDPRRLRQWFLYAAVAVAVIALIAFAHRRFSLHTEPNLRPQPLSTSVARSTQGFSLSKTEGGRTLFTIHAAQAIEYKEGGTAELKDVNIIVFGKAGDRYDEISGKDFQYDPGSGDVKAIGPVSIDLEPDPGGNGALAPPREQKNIVHVRTSDLQFNQKTGIAITAAPVDFHLPQATGSAVGARWESNSGELELDSNVQVSGSGAHQATIAATSALLTRTPHQVVMQNATVTQPGRTLSAHTLTAQLDAQNEVQRIIAEGDVRSVAQGESGAEYHAQAPHAEFFLAKNKLESAQLRQGVSFDASGPRPARGSAQTATLSFGPDQHISTIHAAGDVHFLQPQKSSNAHPGQTLELIADAVDLFSGAGGHIERGQTSGAARIELRSAPTPKSASSAPTVITAGQFNAAFSPSGAIQNLIGQPNAKIVSPNPDPRQSARVSTSDRVTAAFDSRGGVSSLLQSGNVHYDDGQRQAFAQQGRYTPADQLLVLTGSPRVTDSSGYTTATVIRMNRATGESFAEGDVKTTYLNSSSQPANGALLGSRSPVHVTAGQMHAAKATGLAQYRGHARLWQDANIIQAPEIDFDRNQRSLTARSTAAQWVESVLVQNNGKGGQMPATITAQNFIYQDSLRKAHYESHVTMKSSEGTLTSDSLDVFLKPRPSGPTSSAQAPQPSQIDHAIARGHVSLQQPGRTAVGEQLVYTDSDQKFVLTGSPTQLPQVTDIQHGVTRGDELVFYRDQQRVLVQGQHDQRAWTQTRVK